MSNIAIKTQNLSKVYKMGNYDVKALDSINLEIENGSFAAITGTSGSGKTTLMHILGGLDTPTSGEVYISTENLKNMKDKELSKFRREKIGFVFQNFCLVKELNVIENISLPVLLSNRKVDINYIDNLCEELGISNRKKHLPSELSGGQQQRVAIARALSNNPQIILCDEPTGNLDKKTSEEVIELLKNISQKFNKTVLIVTHDSDIANMSDLKIHIEDGKICI